MVRAPRIDENGIKKGAWSADEDNKLRSYILKYGHPNWRNFPSLSRCGKSCRLRWVNYLSPDMKHGNYTKEEDDLIIKLHDELGNKWSAIAKKVPGRSDNEIKNHWHTHLKKRSKKNIHILPKKEPSGESASESDKKEQTSRSSPLTGLNEHQQFTETSLFEVNKGKESTTSDASSGQSSSTELSFLSFDNSSVFDWIAEESMLSSETLGSFWREPFLRDIDTAEYMYFASPPSPIRGEEYLWSYDNDGYIL